MCWQMRTANFSIVLAVTLVLTGCKDIAPKATLYRAHPTIEGWQIRVAVFDREGDPNEIGIQNVEACSQAATLLTQASGNKDRYWCDPALE